MHDSNMIAQAYLALWNEERPELRRAALQAAWAPEARYVDPLMEGVGHDGIAAMITTARTHFPGHHFALRGTPDGHGAFVRFGWTLAAPGAPGVDGTDVLRLDQQGRIAEVIGFLEGAGQ